jgi:hypothetical protein
VVFRAAGCGWCSERALATGYAVVYGTALGHVSDGTRVGLDHGPESSIPSPISVGVPKCLGVTAVRAEESRANHAFAWCLVLLPSQQEWCLSSSIFALSENIFCGAQETESGSGGAQL